MDVCKLLKTVNNVDDYISATENMLSNHSNSRIQFNMSTVLALKKIRSIEIEYFTKCNENGAALKIFELMLQTPSSKTWSLLGKELILLIQYWLDAIRKHLILHTVNWWSFLSVLLKFIQEINKKNVNLNIALIQETTEGLLDLATQNQPDVKQKYKIVQCLNSFCAESSREIRLALREKFEDYFVKLSLQMAVCGDLRTQYSIMETLLRWLLPRQDLAVRRQASAKWFPSPLYSRDAVDIFMKRAWQNFFKDARDFLNAHNEADKLVTSFLCRGFSIGNLALISKTDKKDYYVDLNSGSKCISLMLEPKMLEVLGGPISICDALVIEEDNTDNVQLYRNFPETLISVTIIDPQRMYSSSVISDCDVTLVISSSANLKRVDRALRKIFENKYQLLIDVDDHNSERSPRKRETRRLDYTSEDDSRFSHPVDIQRGKHSGYISRNVMSWQSPSTASTSSLAMLKDKLSALPGYRFNKEPVSVCAEPDLSCVTEVTETEDNINASQSTFKLTTFGVCHKKIKKNKKAKCQSDKDSSKVEEAKCTTPIVNENENSISCLLVATIGSADDSVINDTLERLPKNKEINTDNIVDLLTREALQTFDNNHNKNIEVMESEIANNNLEPNNILAQKKQTIISNTTTDESNTEVFEDTPNVANVPREKVSKTMYEKIDEVHTNKQTYDIQAVEDFFSQHFTENRDGDIVISPTLAKKINETSSESSQSFDFPIMNIDTEFDFNEVEIVECLNDIVDKVCKDFDKCAELFSEDFNTFENDITVVESQVPIDEVTNSNIKNNNKRSKKISGKSVKGIKLNFKKTELRPRNKNKLDLENVNRMSPITERDSAVDNLNMKDKSPEGSEKKSEYETPLIRRKRKLYSPKDDHKANEEVGIYISETEEDTMPSAFKVYEKTPKTLATSYKEIDSIRKDSIRKLRNKKILKNPLVSPRTKKMNDMFDNLKKIEDNQEKILIANKTTRNKKLAVYNFNSDSEDEDDFKLRKPARKSTATTDKTTKYRATRRSKRINKTDNSESNENNCDEINVKKKYIKPRTIKTRSNIKKQTLKSRDNLEDERMREGEVDALNASFVVEKPQRNKTEVDPIINKPQMESLTENTEKNKKRNKKDLSLKKRDVDKIKDIHSDKDSESPLPGLIVETADIHKETDDSVKSVMLDNLKDISEFNTTQNLLDDLEQNNKSLKLNITDEFNQVKPKCQNKSKEGRATVRQLSSGSEASDKDEVIKDNSDVSIATLGRSPITARGDLDGSPPNTEHLKQPVAPRELEIEHLNQSMKEYFNKLTKQLNNTTSSHTSSTKKINAPSNVENTKIIKNSPVKVILDKSPSVSIARLSSQELRKWLPTKLNSIFGSNQSSEVSIRVTRSRSKSSRNNEITSNATKSVILRKSLISPVKMFGEVDQAKSESTEGDDYVTRIKGIMTRKILKPQSPKSKENISKCENTSTISKKQSKSGTKRKSSPILSVTKRSKVNSKSSVGEVTVETASSSSIQEWFKKNDRDNPCDNIDQSLTDQLEQIMEKLDTTLVEINHMTSKKFVSMFVDAQKHLTELEADRRRLYRETARHVITGIVELMDEKFANLDNRSKELDEQFIENIKGQAKQLIRDDCKQKRMMVTLLREDIQTVLKHARNNND